MYIIYTGFNQLSQQDFVENTEMQYRVISPSPPLQGRMKILAVPVQMMVIVLLMLTLPFVVRDLIAPEVCYELVCTWYTSIHIE